MQIDTNICIHTNINVCLRFEMIQWALWNAHACARTHRHTPPLKGAAAAAAAAAAATWIHPPCVAAANEMPSGSVRSFSSPRDAGATTHLPCIPCPSLDRRRPPPPPPPLHILSLGGLSLAARFPPSPPLLWRVNPY